MVIGAGFLQDFVIQKASSMGYETIAVDANPASVGFRHADKYEVINIVDENALLDALDNKLFGAVLDVFSEEPLSTDNPLWKKENVIITPHNSFVGDGTLDRLYKIILKNLG